MATTTPKTPEELAELEAKKALKEEEKAAKAKKEEGKADEGETVTISRAKLEAVLGRLDRLEAVASKANLAHYDSQHKEKMTKEVRLRRFEGKIVVNERMTKNIVEKTPQGVWREDQEIEITFQDGTKLVLPYVYYIRAYKHVVGRVVAETKLMDEIDIETKGDTLFKIVLQDGSMIEIGSKFIN